MNMIKCKMMQKAINKYGEIKPIIGYTWEGSFIFEPEVNQLLFWFDTSDESTHLIMEEQIQ